MTSFTAHFCSGFGIYHTDISKISALMVTLYSFYQGDVVAKSFKEIVLPSLAVIWARAMNFFNPDHMILLTFPS